MKTPFVNSKTVVAAAEGACMEAFLVHCRDWFGLIGCSFQGSKSLISCHPSAEDQHKARTMEWTLKRFRKYNLRILAKV